MTALHRIALGLMAIALLAGFRGDRALGPGGAPASPSGADAPSGTASLPRIALIGTSSLALVDHGVGTDRGDRALHGHSLECR